MYACTVAYTGKVTFLQGTSNTRPCITGHHVPLEQGSGLQQKKKKKLRNLPNIFIFPERIRIEFNRNLDCNVSQSGHFSCHTFRELSGLESSAKEYFSFFSRNDWIEFARDAGPRTLHNPSLPGTTFVKNKKEDAKEKGRTKKSKFSQPRKKNIRKN